MRGASEAPGVRGAPQSARSAGKCARARRSVMEYCAHPECAERQECEVGVERLECVEFLQYSERFECPGVEGSLRESG